MIRVAVIDDHAVVRMGLKYAISLAADLEFAGELVDGAGAAAFVLTEKPDVTLLDIRMPGTDGLAALQSILAVKPSAKVVMLTTSEAEDDIYRAIRLGAKGYVVKDRDSNAILRAVRRVAEGGTYFPDAIMDLYNQRRLMPDLTERESEVLQHVATGKTNPEIGEAISATAETVKIHIKHIFEKMCVSTRAECVAEAFRRGLLKV